jgi:hypothetical protein
MQAAQQSPNIPFSSLTSPEVLVFIIDAIICDNVDLCRQFIERKYMEETTRVETSNHHRDTQWWIELWTTAIRYNRVEILYILRHFNSGYLQSYVAPKLETNGTLETIFEPQVAPCTINWLICHTILTSTQLRARRILKWRVLEVKNFEVLELLYHCGYARDALYLKYRDLADVISYTQTINDIKNDPVLLAWIMTKHWPEAFKEALIAA